MTNQDYTILIVDDEDDILEFVGYNLRKEEYNVITATNGIDAIKLAKEKIPAGFRNYIAAYFAAIHP